MLIGTTATIGLLLVGVLALSITPDRLGSPEDTLISTTNVVAGPGAETAIGVPVGAPQSLANSVLRAVSTLISSTSVSGNEVAAPNPLVPAPTATDPAPVTTRAPEATEPVAIAGVGIETTQPSNPAPSALAVTAGPASSSAAAFTTQVDGAPEPTFDAALVLAGADALTLSGPGPATSSTAPGQPTTSTSSSSTSTSTSTSTTSSTTTEPASSTTLGSAAKQLNNDG